MATATVFRDQIFLHSSWTQMVQVCDTPLGTPDPKATMLCSQIITFGNHAFRQAIHRWGKPPHSRDNGVIFVKHLQKDSIFKPSTKGAITSIDFSCSLMAADRSAETVYALLIEQNNCTYVSNRTFNVRSVDWTTFSLYDLNSTDFRKIDCLVDNPHRRAAHDDHPNFSMLGKDIYFGYVTLSATGAPTCEAVSGIGNWKVSILHENIESASQQRKIMQLEHNLSVLQYELNTTMVDLKKERTSSASIEKMLEGERNASAERAQKLVESEREAIEQEVQEIAQQIDGQYQQTLTEVQLQLKEAKDALEVEKENAAKWSSLYQDTRAEVEAISAENDVLKKSEALLSARLDTKTGQMDSLLEDLKETDDLYKKFLEHSLLLEKSNQLLVYEVEAYAQREAAMKTELSALENVQTKLTQDLHEYKKLLSIKSQCCEELENNMAELESEFEAKLQMAFKEKENAEKALQEKIDKEDEEWEVVAPPS